MNHCTSVLKTSKLHMTRFSGHSFGKCYSVLAYMVTCWLLFKVYTDCSLAMKINGFHGDMHNPSVGLRQGCPLSATLFGLFLDGLHHHLQVSVPDAGIKIQYTWLTDMEYADDVFLLAHCPSYLQALITALADYCQELHMQVSIAKTKVMIIGDDTQTILHARTSLWSKLKASSTWACPFISLVTLLTSSHQSSTKQQLLGQLCSKSTHSCNAVKLFVWSFACFNPFLPLPFTMVALFGACIVPQIQLPTIFANS